MDALKLRATLGLDKKDYDDGLKDAENNAGQTGSKIAGLFTGTAKAVGAGLAAASAAVGGLVKSSVDAYSEYEQLTGGVETLFGTSYKTLKEYADSVGKDELEVAAEMGDKMRAQAEVMNNAANAYKTAGLSANEYMETVTGMAAALKQSTETNEDAAKKADQAIVDMSDNANKMGTSMEMIQNAYSGFAKSNFTMLDNLKLGYGGTKEEMERLLEDAEKISGVEYDISSYADIVDAIHVVQTEMGITGTTAKEASTTIQGSLGMVSAAWQNLVTGITNPDADISQLIDDLVGSVKTAAKNVIPAISQALKGVGQVIEEIAPIISDELPGLVEELLPSLLEAATTLLGGLIDAFPDLLQVIFDQLPTILDTIISATLDLLPMIIELGFQFITAFVDGILEATPQIVPALIDLINQIAKFFIDPNNLLKLLDAAVQIITEIAFGLIDALPVLIPTVVQIIGAIAIALTEPTNLMRLIDAALSLIIAIADGLIQALPTLLEVVPILIINLVEALILLAPQLLKSGAELITKLAMGIWQMRTKAVQAMINVFNAVKDGFKNQVDRAKEWGKDLIQNFIDGILAKWEALKQTVANVAQSVKDFLGFSEPKLGPLSNFHTYAPDMMELFAQGVRDNKQMLIDTVADAFNFAPVIGEVTTPGSNTSDEAKSITNVWNIHLKGEVRSAADFARDLREEEQYGLIGGEPLAD